MDPHDVQLYSAPLSRRMIATTGRTSQFICVFVRRFERCWFLCHGEAPFWLIFWHQRIHLFWGQKITKCRKPCTNSNSLIFGVRLCRSRYSEVYDLPDSSCLRGVARTSKMAYLCCWVRSRSYCPRKGYLRWGTQRPRSYILKAIAEGICFLQNQPSYLRSP